VVVHSRALVAIFVAPSFRRPCAQAAISFVAPSRRVVRRPCALAALSFVAPSRCVALQFRVRHIVFCDIVAFVAGLETRELLLSHSALGFRLAVWVAVGLGGVRVR
jgi:hypothetical protein